MGRDASEEADLLAEFVGEVEVTDTRPGHVVKPKYFNFPKVVAYVAGKQIQELTIVKLS